MSISGADVYWVTMVTGRDANRGDCAQSYEWNVL